MSARRGRRKSGLLLDLFAWVLIPGYTLLLAGGARWLGTNFSALAVTGAGRYRGFLFWGLLVGGYFFLLLSRLAAYLPGFRARLLLRLLTGGACLCLIYALAIPYLPAYFPRFAALHVLLAALACGLLMAALLVALLALERARPGRFGRLLLVWAGIAAGSGALFLLAGMVSSALEVFFTVATVLLLRRLWLAARER